MLFINRVDRYIRLNITGLGSQRLVAVSYIRCTEKMFEQVSVSQYRSITFNSVNERSWASCYKLLLTTGR